MVATTGPRSFTGNEASEIGWLLAEHFNPGQRASVVLGVDQPTTGEDAAALQAELRASGLMDADVAVVRSTEWPGALRVRFTRPSAREVQAQALPLLLIGALTAAGIGGAVLGFKLAPTSIGDTLSRSLLPLALIGAGTYLAAAYVRRQRT